MIDLNQKLNEDEKDFCEYWLMFHTTLFSNLTNTRFTIVALEKMIVYETHTRKRKHVVNRLLGRYYKLCRSKEFYRIAEAMEDDDGTGENYRKVSVYEGTGVRWPGDKANIVELEGSSG